MEAALVSVATGVLKPVIGKLVTLLGDKYKHFKGVHKEIKSLTHELCAMEAFLVKMSEEEDPGEQDKAWMNEVRELSYDMENCIDDFIKCANEKDTKPDGIIEKIKHSLQKLGKMKVRCRIGNEIKYLKKQITEVGERNARYKTREVISNTKNAIVDPRALAIFEHASKLIGIDEPKAKINRLLTGGASSQEQPKLVSIVGSGGLGKTTLANQVYQDLKWQFKCRIFLSVSRNPDMMNIMRTILTEVSGRGYAATEAGSIQQLISKINDFLAGKRYFVVIDDIWDVDTWDVIKLAFPMTSPGSIIITTTRINDVAEACRSSFSGNIYRMKSLNMVHSRQLFHRRLLCPEEDCPSNLEKVSDEILRKCGGVPLAIIAISGLLANRGRTEILWNQVKDSIGRALERNPSVEKMMKILSLSYFDLPPHLKTCLLYLAIFPEDFLIDKKDLIRRWIGEGFILADGIYTSYELGERCYNELINRSLIQPVQSKRYGNNIMNSCRVHDIVLDFIISKAVEENFVTLVGLPNLTIETQSKVCRLSIQAGKQGHFILPKGLVLSHARSVSVFVESVEIPSLDVFKHLRVLDLRGCKQLENHYLANIGRLFQLRYLNLRQTNISQLSEQIGHLHYLEILDIRGTNVSELPEIIVNLRKLSHLLVHYVVKFPDGIANMQALEMLKQVTLVNQPPNFMSELGQLKNLKKLVLNFKGSDERNEDVAPSIRGQNLHSLTIHYGCTFLMHSCLCPMPLTLQELVAWGSTVPRVPNWMGSLVNLEQLRLQLGRVPQQEDLCILGALPALVTLHLNVSSKTGRLMREDRITINGAVGFRSLRKFCYDIQPQTAYPMFAAGSMPKLEILEIHYGASTDEIDESELRQLGMENLPCLATFRCILYDSQGDNDEIEGEKAAARRAVDRHPNHPTLMFRSEY